MAGGASSLCPPAPVSSQAVLPGSALASPLGDRLTDMATAASDAAQGAERLDAYVRLLIEASRGEAMVGELVPVEAATLADEVRAAVEPLTRAAGVRLDFEQSVTSRTIRADIPSLVRAVLNVVSNACDHAPAGGRVRISLCDEADEADGAEDVGCLAITVEDDGPGFSPEALEHGCERFFRGDAARSGAASGEHYGIGLSSASEIVRAHGGDIELANRLDPHGTVSGARVTITVPVIRQG